MNLKNDSNFHKNQRESGLINNIPWQFAHSLQKILDIYPEKFCLITGAPRSGTSAICEWLNNHPEISGFFESRILVSSHFFMEELGRFTSLSKDKNMLERMIRKFITNYYSSSRVLLNKKIVLDKEPLEPIAFPNKDYEKFLENVKLIFPEIKLIFSIRNPVSTIWSMTQRAWGESIKNFHQREFSLDSYIDNWCSCADLAIKISFGPKCVYCPIRTVNSKP